MPELYRMCEIARKMLDGPNRVGRVIARPFVGAPGNFRRTERRHDYAVEPPRPMLMDALVERGVPVFGIGKIHDIYNGRGVEHYVTTKNNADGMEKLHAALTQRPSGLIFANLVDFDMLYGHRKDMEGFARSLEEFDALLGPFLDALVPADLLLITADHGCDPDPEWPDDGSFAGVCADSGVWAGGAARGEPWSAGDTRGYGADDCRKLWRADFAWGKLFEIDCGIVAPASPPASGDYKTHNRQRSRADYPHRPSRLI